MRIATSNRVSTGIPGLDEILHGGFIAGRSYLVNGEFGTGKTTLGLHFLAGGVADGDRPLFICVNQAEEHVRSDASTLGIPTDDLSFLDLTPDGALFSETQTYDIFSPFEVERESVARDIANRIEEARPRRIFVDGLGEFHRLASDPFQFRRLVQSFFRFVSGRHATLLLSSVEGTMEQNAELCSAADGVIVLGDTGRSRYLLVRKFRGSDYEAGRHPIRLTAAGFQVFPT
jgi:circadian clock protein KaiC